MSLSKCDSGGEEEEESKGGADDQMLEAEKGRMLWGLQGELETGFEWSRMIFRRLGKYSNIDQGDK